MDESCYWGQMSDILVFPHKLVISSWGDRKEMIGNQHLGSSRLCTDLHLSSRCGDKPALAVPEHLLVGMEARVQLLMNEPVFTEGFPRSANSCNHGQPASHVEQSCWGHCERSWRDPWRDPFVLLFSSWQDFCAAAWALCLRWQGCGCCSNVETAPILSALQQRWGSLMVLLWTDKEVSTLLHVYLKLLQMCLQRHRK